MANWKQVQARIRRAKNSADAPAQLTELFEKTRDAMVAFELGELHEKAGERDEAVRWFTTAAERFRRASWKQKAADALTRLGAEVPVLVPSSDGEPAAPASEDAAETAPQTEASQPETSPASASRKGRTRRGRRGGRRHRRRKEKIAPAADTKPPVEARVVQQEPEPVADRAPEAEVARAPRTQGIPRTSELAMASRLAYLESQLRRLLAAPLHTFDDIGESPAGPGVYVLSESDLTTHYFVEACRTLRIGLQQWLGTGRGSRGRSTLQKDLGRHLGIGDTKAAKYLREHCAVRWLQLDEGAAELAHFAIAVLQPELNE